MAPDLRINSLIIGWLMRYSPVDSSSWPAVSCAVLILAQYISNMATANPTPPTPVLKTCVRSFFSLEGDKAVCILSLTPKISRHRDRKRLPLEAPACKSLFLTGVSHQSIHSHQSVHKVPLPFIYFLPQGKYACLLKRFQMELNLEPFKGWMEGRLSMEGL